MEYRVIVCPLDDLEDVLNSYSVTDWFAISVFHAGSPNVTIVLGKHLSTEDDEEIPDMENGWEPDEEDEPQDV